MKNPYTKTQQKQITELYEKINWYEELDNPADGLTLWSLRTRLAAIEDSVPENLKG
jgi:hypothetical protein